MRNAVGLNLSEAVQHQGLTQWPYDKTELPFPLDFDQREDDIPENWNELRKEARNAVEQGIKVDNGILGIYSTKFEKIVI